MSTSKQIELRDLLRPAYYHVAKCSCADGCGAESAITVDHAYIASLGMAARNALVTRAHMADGFVLIQGGWYAKGCAEVRLTDPRSRMIFDNALIARDALLKIEVEYKMAKEAA